MKVQRTEIKLSWLTQVFLKASFQNLLKGCKCISISLSKTSVSPFLLLLGHSSMTYLFRGSHFCKSAFIFFPLHISPFIRITVIHKRCWQSLIKIYPHGWAFVWFSSANTGAKQDIWVLVLAWPSKSTMNLCKSLNLFWPQPFYLWNRISKIPSVITVLPNSELWAI